MPKLIYSAIASLDGYVEDEEGNFDGAAPDGEVHAVGLGVGADCHDALHGPVIAGLNGIGRMGGA